MTEPNYCPLCLKEKVIATIGGPTCRHGNFDWDEFFKQLEMSKKKGRQVPDSSSTHRPEQYR
jgi:hypothetical protein